MYGNRLVMYSSVVFLWEPCQALQPGGTITNVTQNFSVHKRRLLLTSLKGSVNVPGLGCILNRPSHSHTVIYCGYIPNEINWQFVLWNKDKNKINKNKKLLLACSKARVYDGMWLYQCPWRGPFTFLWWQH